MKQNKITIEIKSDTLFASSEGGAVIDTVTQHKPNGLPYIPAKTLKGLLKESCMEVQEILGKVDQKQIHDLFGKEGTEQRGKLIFEDAMVEDYTKFSDVIAEKKLKRNEVLDYFTTIRYQTSLTYGGIAKEGSLRTSLCLKPGNKFIFIIKGDVNEDDKKLLKYALLNLRRVGTNRNRGFGLVEMKEENIEWIEPKQSLNTDQKSNDIICNLKNVFKIKLESAALLPANQPDANIVSSEKIISGRKILGMLASAYIRDKKLGEGAHVDKDFKRIFLSGAVKFSNAYPVKEDAMYMPLGQHWVKDKGSAIIQNDYARSKGNEIENLKAIGGLVSYDGASKKTPSTLLEFHNSRNRDNQKEEKTQYHSRIKGSNQGDGIYYYEPLKEGQEFCFTIDGEENDLAVLRSLLAKSNLSLGKATSTALGKISIEPSDAIFKPNENQNTACILTFISPLILQNNNGDYIASLDILSRYLDMKIDTQKARIRTTNVQVFQTSIKMQFPEMIAIEAGSSIYFENGLPEVLKDKNSIGCFTHEGYGQFIIESTSELNTKQEKLLQMVKHKVESKDDKVNLDVNSQDKLEKHVAIEREKIDAANQVEAVPKIDKALVHRMIDLGKEMERNSSLNLKECIEISVKNQFGLSKITKKQIEGLAKFTALDKDKALEQRNEKHKNYISGELDKMIVASLFDFIETKIIANLKKKEDIIIKSNYAKITRFQTYFNTAKIDNRK